MTADAPRVGLVLGAGGVAGGAFHSGVLAALEDVIGWDPRSAAVIVGTSAGSIAGASLRAGLSAADLLARSEDRPVSAEGQRLLRDVPPTTPPAFPAGRQRRAAAQVAATLARSVARPLSARPWALLASVVPDGSISTDVISAGMAALHPGPWPAEPLLICAVRQSDGRRIAFGRRDDRPELADAVAASCAIPGFFSPVVIDGESYIDGGAHSPTNADVLTDPAYELDLVVVSSPMSISGRGFRLAADQIPRRWSATLLDAEARRLRRRGIPVVAFQPTAADAAVMGTNPMDPARRGVIARQARESTERRLARRDTRTRLAALVAG